MNGRQAYLLLLTLLLLAAPAYSRQEKPFIKLVQPVREVNTVATTRQFISGSTCPGCTLSINDQPVKVYNTGGFAHELQLTEGENNIILRAVHASGSSLRKQLTYRFFLPQPPDTVKSVSIATIETMPAGSLIVVPGDKIFFRVKALPGANVKVNGHTNLYEMPVTKNNPLKGIYQGEYTIQKDDSLPPMGIPVEIMDASGKTAMMRTPAKITLLNPEAPDMIISKGRLAHLLYGTGEDRLGGAKIGYIDSLIPLRITGKTGSNYRVQLSPGRAAYIPDDVVEFLPKGSFQKTSLTGSWRVYGDSIYDYVAIALEHRLPYQSWQLLDPSRIVLDIFGAVNNTNWITQLETAKEISHVSYEQVEEAVLRVTISLKKSQHWGHSIYYTGNTLVLKVKRQPPLLQLNALKIAVDAGHGGSNTGAAGPTGSSEKMLALAVSLKLQKALQKQGATVIMTRNTERFFDNKERILFYRDSTPDLLLSVHYNSSSDPVNVGGTGVFYRHTGFRPFGHAIYKRLLETGLKEYGNVGSFNFMLNSPTEYPNALLELLFISNPAEEALILDENFQQAIVDKIVAGVKDFLLQCEETKKQ